eukprot:SAG31_NODE_20910_length_562_cov_1.447084_1_plen_89_part_01
MATHSHEKRVDAVATEAMAKVQRAIADWADGGSSGIRMRDQAVVQRISAFLERYKVQRDQPASAAFYSALIGICSDCGETAAARNVFEA